MIQTLEEALKKINELDQKNKQLEARRKRILALQEDLWA